jgi:hypothetical protein
MRISRGDCVRWIRPVEVRTDNPYGQGTARLIFLDQGPGGERELEDCPICMDAPPDTLLLDCQHMLCAVCARKWVLSGRPCHICQQPIVDTCLLDRSEGLLGERVKARSRAGIHQEENDEEVMDEQRAIQASLEKCSSRSSASSIAATDDDDDDTTPKKHSKLGRWWKGVKKSIRKKAPVVMGGDEIPAMPELDIRGAPILEAKSFIYEKSVLRFRVGQPVVPLGFDPNLNLRCGSGLHGFRSMSHPELVQMAEHYYIPPELCTRDNAHIDHPCAPEVEATLPLLREIITHTGLACDVALLAMQYALTSNLDQAAPQYALKTQLVDAAMQEEEEEEEEEKKSETDDTSAALTYLRTQVSLAGDELCELYPDADIAVLESGTEQAYLQCHRRRLVEWIEPRRIDCLPLSDNASTSNPTEIRRAVLARGHVVVSLHFARAPPNAHPLTLLHQLPVLPRSIAQDAYPHIRILVTTRIAEQEKALSVSAWH